MIRIALNGLGRIGKLALRDLIDTGAGGEIVLLNDPVGDAEPGDLVGQDDLSHVLPPISGRSRRRAGGPSRARP